MLIQHLTRASLKMANKIFASLFMVILTTGTLRGGNPLSNYWNLSDSNELLQNTVSKLEKENQRLKSEIEKIKKSDSYARKVLRDKYHITEDDEQIIFFAD